MNKLIFNDVGLWPHRQELCELARLFKDENNNVFFVSSIDSFPCSPPNPLNSYFASQISYFINLQIHNNLKKYNINCSFLNKNGIKKIDSIIKRFEGNKDILNSIYGQYCELLSDGLAEKDSSFYRKFKKNILSSLAYSSNKINKFLDKNKIDEIVVWNGRRPGEVFLVQLAKEKNIKFSSVITSQKNGFFLYKEDWRDVNDINKFSELIDQKLRHYFLNGFSKNDLLMSELYYKRASGSIKKPSSFSSKGFYTYSEKYFNSEKLEKDLKDLKLSGKKIVSIFPGTFMEYISLPNYSLDPIFNNHYDHINFLLNQNHTKNTHFILRFHPNQSKLKFNEKMVIKKIIKLAENKDNFTVVPPNLNISSYQIINFSDLVIAIGSSISVEALRNRKKVIFLGCNWFQSLESLCKPKNTEDIIKLINGKNDHHKNSFRDSVIFTNILFNNEGINFSYYKKSNDVFSLNFINPFLIKFANFCVLLSKNYFRFNYSLRTFLKFINY